LKNLKDKVAKNQLSIINHKKRKGKGRKERGHQPEESLMNPGTKTLIPQGNLKCKARI
jgi:hypothetical protein